MKMTDLPTVNAILNALTIVLLSAGYMQIRKGHRRRHRNLMLGAVLSSTLFFASYLTYHFHVGSVRYPRFDWTRMVYFSILIPHVILAAAMLPGIGLLLWFASRDQTARHKQLAHWVWPVWMFVSISGIIVYCMLYHLS